MTKRDPEVSIVDMEDEVLCHTKIDMKTCTFFSAGPTQPKDEQTGRGNYLTAYCRRLLLYMFGDTHAVFHTKGGRNYLT